MLSDWYLWIKAGHVISVISWMAGIFYLPRLLVYHVERQPSGSEPVASFKIMEDKLYRLIMRPAMIATWVFGLALASIPGMLHASDAWVWVKFSAVLGMTAFHFWLGKEVRALAAGTSTMTGKGFRIMNEVPTLLLVLIVVAVIVKF